MNDQNQTDVVDRAANVLEQSGIVTFPDQPQGGAKDPDAQQEVELNEMRIISKRLKALEPPARQRVLAWLSARFAEPKAPA